MALSPKRKESMAVQGSRDGPLDGKIVPAFSVI